MMKKNQIKYEQCITELIAKITGLIIKEIEKNIDLNAFFDKNYLLKKAFFNDKILKSYTRSKV